LTQNARDVFLFIKGIGFFQYQGGHGGGDRPNGLAHIQEAYKHEWIPFRNGIAKINGVR
jgi:hypothetical protein